jgi:hypothetical protein
MVISLVERSNTRAKDVITALEHALEATLFSSSSGFEERKKMVVETMSKCKNAKMTPSLIERVCMPFLKRVNQEAAVRNLTCAEIHEVRATLTSSRNGRLRPSDGGAVDGGA